MKESIECPICCGLKEYDKKELYGSEYPIYEYCDNCGGTGEIIINNKFYETKL
jgi:DnaJ-class molecular chaperone